MPELKAIESEAIRTPAASNIITFFTEEDGNIVLKAKRNDGSVETLVGKAEGYLEFYRCASVGGPYVTEGYIVSGAGKEEVNGNYVLTDMKTDAETPIYKHESREYYYFDIGDEQGICTSPTQSPGSGLYYNLWGEGWTTGSSGVDPAPSVNKGKFTANANAPKTWTGYKVTQTSNGVEVDNDLTETELTYSSIKPVPGYVYSKDGSFITGGFSENIPADLIFKKSFKTMTDHAETGQLLIPAPFPYYNHDFTSALTYSGVRLTGVGGGGFTVKEPDLPLGNAPRTMAVWALQTESYMNNCIMLKYGSRSNFQIGFSSNKPTLWFEDNVVVEAVRSIIFNTWYHLCGTFDGTTLKFYVNGKLVGETARTLDTKIDNYLSLGSYGSNFVNPAKLADARVYARALSAEEVAELAGSFDQGAAIPEENMIFYAPLSSQASTAETGQNMSYSNCVFTTHDGINCMRCNDGNSAATVNIPNIPQGSAARTISFWGCADSYTSDWMGFFSYGTDSPNQLVCVRTNNDLASIGFSYNDHNSTIYVAGSWHHFAMTYDGSVAKLYVNSAMALDVPVTLQTDGTEFKIGAGVSTRTGYRGYIAALRIYDKVLDEDAIKMLACEF